MMVETVKEKALILRTCAADMSSHGGFKWPESGPVSAPDWKATKDCGNGLHGFLWGAGNGTLANWAPGAKWLVAEVEEYIDLTGKVKFPTANVLFCGDRKAATEFIMGGRHIAGDRRLCHGGQSRHGDGGQSRHGDGGLWRHGDGGQSRHGDGWVDMREVSSMAWRALEITQSRRRIVERMTP